MSGDGGEGDAKYSNHIVNPASRRISGRIVDPWGCKAYEFMRKGDGDVGLNSSGYRADVSGPCPIIDLCLSPDPGHEHNPIAISSSNDSIIEIQDGHSSPSAFQRHVVQPPDPLETSIVHDGDSQPKQEAPKFELVGTSDDTHSKGFSSAGYHYNADEINASNLHPEVASLSAAGAYISSKKPRTPFDPSHKRRIILHTGNRRSQVKSMMGSSNSRPSAVMTPQNELPGPHDSIASPHQAHTESKLSDENPSASVDPNVSQAEMPSPPQGLKYPPMTSNRSLCDTSEGQSEATNTRVHYHKDGPTLIREPKPAISAQKDDHSKTEITSAPPKKGSKLTLQDLIPKPNPSSGPGLTLNDIIKGRPKWTQPHPDAKGIEKFHQQLRASFPPVKIGPDYIHYGPSKPKPKFTLLDVVEDRPQEPLFSVEYAIEQHQAQQKQNREKSKALGSATTDEYGKPMPSDRESCSMDDEGHEGKKQTKKRVRNDALLNENKGSSLTKYEEEVPVENPHKKLAKSEESGSETSKDAVLDMNTLRRQPPRQAKKKRVSFQSQSLDGINEADESESFTNSDRHVSSKSNKKSRSCHVLEASPDPQTYIQAQRAKDVEVISISSDWSSVTNDTSSASKTIGSCSPNEGLSPYPMSFSSDGGYEGYTANGHNKEGPSLSASPNGSTARNDQVGTSK